MILDAKKSVDDGKLTPAVTMAILFIWVTSCSLKGSEIEFSYQ
ncbi:hypothetical protein BSIN_0812 [Burkholderia singularis]|uniref:Uncharacterized protein n=1 Tax=Burkholderia singularis TaxID=1503053 RepID=A0A238HAY5_9BURK|nr:hypothetical protein BSIN_0812 [Burkholderia singularis]